MPFIVQKRKGEKVIWPGKNAERLEKKNDQGKKHQILVEKKTTEKAGPGRPGKRSQ